MCGVSRCYKVYGTMNSTIGHQNFCLLVLKVGDFIQNEYSQATQNTCF
jgi:hypothetical protein